MALNDIKADLTEMPERRHDAKEGNMILQTNGIISKQTTQEFLAMQPHIETKLVRHLIKAFTDSNGEVQNIAVKWCPYSLIFPCVVS